MLASRCDASGTVSQWVLHLPRIPHDYTGTGDLTSALLLAWLRRLPEVEQMALVLEKVGATLQAVLTRTLQMDRSEICLVQSREQILEPTVTIRAQRLSC